MQQDLQYILSSSLALGEGGRLPLSYLLLLLLGVCLVSSNSQTLKEFLGLVLQNLKNYGFDQLVP